MPIERGGQLRIGWISSDFRAHSIARNVLPIISRMAGIHFLYSDVKRPDNFTEEFRKRADFWRDVQGLADGDVAELIRADQVNVLVVLAGRFDGNRSFLAAQRAAPIQISMHDVATSGLPNMDYFIADRSIVPADQRQDFTERVIRLPSFYVHDPLDAEPAVSSLPAPPVVFSCFNNPEKITREMAPVWSTILDRVPGSILRLKYRDAYNPPVVRREIGKVLPADRVVFLSRSPNTGEHLKDYAGVHIALDTTPFSGSTTTFEALWMGVPVVTLAGETPPGRWGTSMLRVLKLDDLIAQTIGQYIEIAVALANDAARLARCARPAQRLLLA